MKPNTIEEKLNSLLTDRVHPDLPGLHARAARIDSQRDDLLRQRDTAYTALTTALEGLQESVIEGKPANTKDLAKLRETVHTLEADAAVLAGARMAVDARIAALEATQRTRSHELLQPLFDSLVSTYDRQLQDVAESERLLSLAHRVATSLVTSDSPLSQGYSLNMGGQWRHWRERAARFFQLATGAA